MRDGSTALHPPGPPPGGRRGPRSSGQRRRSMLAAPPPGAEARGSTMLLSRLTVALYGVVVAAEPASKNKFGIGAYGGSYIGVNVSEELPWAKKLVGDKGSVLLVATMAFSQNGNASSCVGDCIPAAVDAAAVRQAYTLGLRPVVRLAQWPRTIRDFADGAPTTRRQYSALAQAYKRFAAALPLPPNGSPLDVVVLNEPNGCGEWQCEDGGAVLQPSEQAAEAGTCLRDILAALRPLPRLRLAAAPTAYTVPPTCSCDGSTNPTPDWDTPTDLAFMADMLKAAPDLYSSVDFFNSHPVSLPACLPACLPRSLRVLLGKDDIG